MDDFVFKELYIKNLEQHGPCTFLAGVKRCQITTRESPFLRALCK